MRRMPRAPWAAAALLVAGCALAFTVGLALRHALALTPAAHAEPATGTLRALAERVIVDKEERGKVNLGDRTVLEIQTLAGGLTGYERAMIVAKRLNDALDAGMAPAQVRAAQVSGMWVVQAGAANLITITPLEAERNAKTQQGLAEAWALAIASALAPDAPPPTTPAGGETPPAAGTTPAGGETPPAAGTTPTAWTPSEEYTDKIVPILSVLHGTRLGAARINGPKSAVDKVQAVAQVELVFRDTLNVNVYVPISTSTPGQTLSRVQGVGVTGVADLQVG